LYSFDQDLDALRNAMCSGFGNRESGIENGDAGNEQWQFVHSNFRYLRNWMRYHGVEQLDGVLADLGVSSHQFDEGELGFSFRYDAKLDMRMNRRDGLTAADIVNNYDEDRLAEIFYLYGELLNGRKLASVIVKARTVAPIETTGQLYETVKRLFGRDREKKEMAKLFQALRIEVNEEMEALKEMLEAATELLKPGGRLVVLTYHSLEDRLVKNLMKTGNVEGRVEQDIYGTKPSPYRMAGKVAVASREEQEQNPRSRSAKLRIGIKR
jgi:16S rRNA (cytosine1402-N4)-methyltransferase